MPRGDKNTTFRPLSLPHASTSRDPAGASVIRNSDDPSASRNSASGSDAEPDFDNVVLTDINDAKVFLDRAHYLSIAPGLLLVDALGAYPTVFTTHSPTAGGTAIFCKSVLPFLEFAKDPSNRTRLPS